MDHLFRGRARRSVDSTADDLETAPVGDRFGLGSARSRDQDLPRLGSHHGEDPLDPFAIELGPDVVEEQERHGGDAFRDDLALGEAERDGEGSRLSSTRPGPRHPRRPAKLQLLGVRSYGGASPSSIAG